MFKIPSLQPIPMLFVTPDPECRACVLTEEEVQRHRAAPCRTTGVTVSGPLSARITGKRQLSHLANIGADSREV